MRGEEQTRVGFNQADGHGEAQFNNLVVVSYRNNRDQNSGEKKVKTCQRFQESDDDHIGL